MDNKIVKVTFEEGWETMYNNDLTQSDYGRALQIEGITLPDGNVEVHFSLTEHNGEAPISIGTVKDNVITVDIPDFILAKENTYNSSYDAYAWIYVTDGESGRTIRKIVFTIDTRAEPTTNVPEDKKDPFLEEVRQIMAETKEIAQSVRDDADNGEFDGEKGEKGDAGSIKFVIVPTLPTEDIDTSAMYLVPSPTEEDKNRFLEYVFVDGKPEIIGSASVEVNLNDYVKNTDYATDGKGGVVKISQYRGMQISADGIVSPKEPTDDWINTRNNGSDTKKTTAITLSKFDYALLQALTDGQMVLTDEQKQLARGLLGAIGANNVDASNGLALLANGSLIISPASKAQIESRTDNPGDTTSQRKPVTLAILDYAVKKALSDCKLEGDDVWTIEEKDNARRTIGIILEPNTNAAYSVPQRLGGGELVVGEPTKDNHATTKKYVDDRFVQKWVGSQGNQYVYVSVGDGTEQTVRRLSDKAENGLGTTTIPTRDAEGGVHVQKAPTKDTHATSKGYVDENFIGKVSDKNIMYGTDKDGNQVAYNIGEFGTPVANRVVVSGANGEVTVGTPTMYNSATPKKYVDDYFAGAGTVKADKAPQYTSDGNLAIGTAKYRYEAINKGYVDDLIAELRAEIEALKG